MFNSDEVLVLSNEFLHVDEQWVEWIVDIATSYHATPHFELFYDYRVWDFGTIKMGNSSHSRIIRMGDVSFETNIMGCKLTLEDVRHVPDLCFNQMLGFGLDKQGYETLISLYYPWTNNHFQEHTSTPRE